MNNQNEYENSDNEVSEAFSSKKLKGQKSYGGTGSDRSNDSLRIAQDILMNKRKHIRSEARNQARVASNEQNHQILNTKELLYDRSKRINSIDAENYIMTRRAKLNFTPEEVSTKIIDVNFNLDSDRYSYKTNPKNAVSVRQSMTINDQYDQYDTTTDHHTTYRLPSISPNSKLPNCFLQK